MTKKERIKEKLKSGLSYDDISNEVKVSKSYISQVKKEMQNEKNENKPLEELRKTAETDDISGELDISGYNIMEEEKEMESLKIRNSNIVYNIENPQAMQREESESLMDLDLTEREEYDQEEKEETVEEIDAELLKYEFLGIYESVNLFMDNFDFYQSKEIKKGKIDAIVKNFQSAYPGRHFMSSKILFFTLVISVFAGNLKIEKIKKSKIFNKFRKNG